MTEPESTRRGRRGPPVRSAPRPGPPFAKISSGRTSRRIRRRRASPREKAGGRRRGLGDHTQLVDEVENEERVKQRVQRALDQFSQNDYGRDERDRPENRAQDLRRLRVDPRTEQDRQHERGRNRQVKNHRRVLRIRPRLRLRKGLAAQVKQKSGEGNENEKVEDEPALIAADKLFQGLELRGEGLADARQLVGLPPQRRAPDRRAVLCQQLTDQRQAFRANRLERFLHPVLLFGYPILQDDDV